MVKLPALAGGAAVALALAGGCTPTVQLAAPDRLQAYTEIATRTGQTVQTVATLAAEKQFERAQPGELVKPASEPWTKMQ